MSNKCIGVYTSGGDAPGMNAAIRAAVRTAIHHNARVKGIYSGYNGMLRGEIEDLHLRSVAGIIQRGGTILKTGRCPDFHKKEKRAEAAEKLRAAGVDALVCIGGDGSFRGAQALITEQDIPVIGVPGTIDNDIFGTDFTIGFDTATNTAVEAIDRIRDTATSHDRMFIIEVMGRDTGYLALDVGIAGGAEDIFIPESYQNLDETVERLQASQARKKQYHILVTAEGQKAGRAYDLAEQLRKKIGVDARVCILGHIQRGGSPSARDRILASALGAAAVDALVGGKSGVMAGLRAGKLHFTPLDEAISKKPSVREDKLLLARILSC